MKGSSGPMRGGCVVRVGRAGGSGVVWMVGVAVAVALTLMLQVMVAGASPEVKKSEPAAAPAAGNGPGLKGFEPVGMKMEFRGGDAVVKLDGAGARQQLVLSGEDASKQVRDLTREATWSVEPSRMAQVSASGLVTPLSDGQGHVVAHYRGGLTVRIPLEVKRANYSAPIHFGNQIVPIFTKLGCNAGGCHGKAGGQNGFRLSLLGFEPAEDYEYLVHEGRGRRLVPAAPDQSLLLLKSCGALPHGGGKRMEVESRDYQLIRRWIAQGMPYGSDADPVVVKISVFPEARVMERGGEQQLVVTATYSDGSTEDVTAGAQYDSNDKDLAQVDANGLVKFMGRAGDVAMMIRYQSKVAVFRANVPMGVEVAELPPTRNGIDEAVFKKLKTVGMPPSMICDDATFLRRVTLDVAGRLPTEKEVRAFLVDRAEDKRARKVDQLLDSPEYADYFANKWAALLRNKRNEDKQARGNIAFHAWIRDSLAENKPYDQMVAEILTASGDMTQNPATVWYRQVRDTTSQMEDVAQLFMGTRMKCAQCHHHPFEKWSQQDYFGFSAFFTQVSRKGGERPGEEMIYHKRGVATAVNKKTGGKVKPAPLGGQTLDLPAEQDPREALAEWMRGKDNPFLAKSLVNRYWKHFFNRAMVEPEDDIRETNPPSNPELFEGLSKAFVDSGFDLKALVRMICNSSTYQLSSEPNAYNAQDKQYYSRYYPKRLTAEVLMDAINVLVKSETKFPGMQRGTRAVELPDNSFNSSSYFLTVFGRPEGASSCECERSQDASLAQSLHLLNSKDLQQKLTSDQGRPAQFASETHRTDEARMEELYLTAFSRVPLQDEIAAAKKHLDRALDKDAEKQKVRRREAFEDILWALMSSKEFLFNH